MRHPDYDDQQVKLAAIRLTLPADLFHAAYPEAGLFPPWLPKRPSRQYCPGLINVASPTNRLPESNGSSSS
jgi:hypothetical protein